MSGRPRLEDEADFIELVRTKGISETAKALGISKGSVFERRERIEKRTGQMITVPDPVRNTRVASEHPGRLSFNIKDGTVIIGSDAHYWPGIISTAHRGFVKFCKELRPKAVILNGDMLDGATISRHPPINWEDRPSLVQELETVKDRLDEITLAAGKAQRFWCLGNHDARLETRLATVAPEYAKIHGVHLKDHFPDYQACWAVWINDGEVVVKHRYKGGIHATHNNTLWSGKTMVTGHLHSQKSTPFSDYDGDRWGVDSGTMAEPYGPQFIYQEDNPRNHRQGFVVMTWVDGELLQPALARVMREGCIDFDRKVHRV